MDISDSLYPELKTMIDALCEAIIMGRIRRTEAEDRIKALRIWAEEVIPYQMEAYDLIYGSRFKRLLKQYMPE